MNESIILQRPEGRPGQLVLLFHGVGAAPADMGATARRAACTLDDAMVVSVAAPYPSDFGAGRQWFSVQGITEQNRGARIAQAMPAFVDSVQHWQRQADVDALRTTLIGFSQGAIMSLAAAQWSPALAYRFLAIAGRMAQPPKQLAAGVRVHLFHGEQDAVIPAHHSIDLAACLSAQGYCVTLDTFEGLGHGIDERILTRLAEHLKPRARAGT
jgi:phospholipase/carboxylesterase